eukprot:TRINITY_DN28432_c0_g1_i1.p1 TRINITY_DN28432_c0_g1~~TRINITY_DN28432_c0_g1_i1.p1  ORF type:complete len:1035 (+),score=304.28 TRINITY_DN28432_c0_g1_i1:80-3184(+)
MAGDPQEKDDITDYLHDIATRIPIEKLLALRPPKWNDPGEPPGLTLAAVPKEENQREERKPRRDRAVGLVTECVSVSTKITPKQRFELKMIETDTGAQVKERSGLRGSTVMITGTMAVVKKALPLVEEALFDQEELPPAEAAPAAASQTLPPWLQGSINSSSSKQASMAPIGSSVPVGASASFPSVQRLAGSASEATAAPDDEWQMPHHWKPSMAPPGLEETASLVPPVEVPTLEAVLPNATIRYQNDDDDDEGFWDELPPQSPPAPVATSAPSVGSWQDGGSSPSNAQPTGAVKKPTDVEIIPPLGTGLNVEDLLAEPVEEEQTGPLPGRWRRGRADDDGAAEEAPLTLQAKGPPPAPAASQVASSDTYSSQEPPVVVSKAPLPKTAPPPPPPPSRKTASTIPVEAPAPTLPSEAEAPAIPFKAPASKAAPAPTPASDAIKATPPPPWTTVSQVVGPPPSKAPPSPAISEENDTALGALAPPAPEIDLIAEAEAIIAGANEAAKLKTKIAAPAPSKEAQNVDEELSVTSAVEDAGFLSAEEEAEKTKGPIVSNRESTAAAIPDISPIASAESKSKKKKKKVKAQEQETSVTAVAASAIVQKVKALGEIFGRKTKFSAMADSSDSEAESEETPPVPSSKGTDSKKSKKQISSKPEIKAPPEIPASKPPPQTPPLSKAPPPEIPASKPPPQTPPISKPPSEASTIDATPPQPAEPKSTKKEKANKEVAEKPVAKPPPAKAAVKAAAKMPVAKPPATKPVAKAKLNVPAPSAKQPPPPVPKPSVWDSAPKLLTSSSLDLDTPLEVYIKEDSGSAIPRKVPPPKKQQVNPPSNGSVGAIPKKAPPPQKQQITSPFEDSDSEEQGYPRIAPGAPAAKAKASVKASAKASVKASPPVTNQGLNPLPRSMPTKAAVVINQGMAYGLNPNNAATSAKWQERPVERIQPGGYYEEEEDPDMQCYLWDRRSAQPRNNQLRITPKVQAAPPILSVQKAAPSLQRQKQMLKQVMDMGFDEPSAKRALTSTGWTGVQEAISVILGA